MAESDLAGHHTRASLPSDCATTTTCSSPAAAATISTTCCRQGSIGPYVPTADFETGLFSIFTAGNFGSDIAFWVDDDISVCRGERQRRTGRGLPEVRQRRPVSEAAGERAEPARGPDGIGHPVHPVQVDLGQSLRHLQPGQRWRGQSGLQPAVREQLVHACRVRPGHRVQRRTPHRRLQLLACLHQPEHQRRGTGRERGQSLHSAGHRQQQRRGGHCRRMPTSRTSTPASTTASTWRKTRKAATPSRLQDRAGRATTPI